MHRSILALLAVLLTFTVACNSGGSGGEGGESGGEGGESAEAEERTPEGLGEAIAETYFEAMTELQTMLAARPPADQLATDLAALKERHIQTLVELGAEREAMEAGDRSTVDSTFQGMMWGPDAPDAVRDLAWMTDAQTHYRPSSNDIANDIASFNILTQYAVYELLREQEPEEAARLGIGE